MTKKQQRARIVIREVLFALAVALFFVILVLIAMGYRLRRGDSGIPVLERTAMLRVSSFPTNANITLDGTDTGKRTTLSAQRLVISSGEHQLTVAKEGYQTWQHDFTAVEAEITWFDYLQLFPTDRTGEVIASFPSTNQIWSSPSGERALVVTPAIKNTSQKLNLLELSDQGVEQTAINLSEALDNPDFIAWAHDESQAVLCERQNSALAITGNTCALIELARQQLSSLALPIKKDATLQKIAFLSPRRLLVMTSSEIFIYNLTSKSKTASADWQNPQDLPPAQLLAYVDDAVVLYHVSEPTAEHPAEYWLSLVEDNDAFKTTGFFSDTEPFHYAITRYLNELLLVISNRSQLRVYSTDSSNFTGTLTPRDEFTINSIMSAIAANGRFITTADGLAVDLERHATNQFDNLCQDKPWQRLNSALNYCATDDALQVQDFDGANRVTIPAIDETTIIAPAALINRRALYYWSVTPLDDLGAYALQLRQLRL